MNKGIEDTLRYIDEHIGLKLNLCDHFTGLYSILGKKYFNVVLNDKVNESKEYAMLSNLSCKHGSIGVMQNGLRRVAVFSNDFLS